MRVYLFKDYLKTINGEPLRESQLVCEIDTVNSIPDGLVRIKEKLARVCMLSECNIYIEFIGKIPEEDDVYCSDNITCPNCGQEDRDSWEAPDSDDEKYCEVCGSVFSYERNIEITYSSSVVERNESVLPLT